VSWTYKEGLKAIENNEEFFLGIGIGLFAAAGVAYIVSAKEPQLPRQDNKLEKAPVPLKLYVPYDRGGFYFGNVSKKRKGHRRGNPYRQRPAGFYGKSMDKDGNILIIGGPGSGKTTGHVYPTMKTWKGSMVMVDVKGGMEKLWRSIHKGDVKELTVFTPLQMGASSCTFDPFFLMKADPSNAAGHACDIAEALVAISTSDREPFWKESAQNLLAGSLLHYFHCGKSFIEAMKDMSTRSVSEIICMVMNGDCEQAKSFVSKMQGISGKTAASVGLNLTSLSRFLLNPGVIGSLTPGPERPTLDWMKLNSARKPFDVIIDVHGVALAQCAPLVRLMLTQLVKTLSLRDEKHYGGNDLPPVLICIDEFPQLERIPAMINALTTLRSKGVTMALCVQSLASLDATYGHDEARVILDACRYKVIRNANDVESQKYLSALIGTTDVAAASASISKFGANATLGRRQRPLVYPEELGRLRKSILITPYGTCQVTPGKIYPPAPTQQQREIERLSTDLAMLRSMVESFENSTNRISNDTAQEQVKSSPVKECDSPDSSSVREEQQMDTVCKFCAEAPRSTKEIMAHLGIKARPYFVDTILKPLLDQGRLVMTHPESPKHPDQKYLAACTD